MGKGEAKFERLWRREAGKLKGKEKEAMRKATARAAKRRNTEGGEVEEHQEGGEAAASTK